MVLMVLIYLVLLTIYIDGYHHEDGVRLPNVTVSGCWLDGSYVGINVSRRAVESIEATTGSRLS